ncbi:hypothetical protein NMY22_g2620 [Coprinellus aureogranulatus]|nr:hypothetical protein NMY22_g2620 [Coprinellus aureogranulatus]
MNLPGFCLESGGAELEVRERDLYHSLKAPWGPGCGNDAKCPPNICYPDWYCLTQTQDICFLPRTLWRGPPAYFRAWSLTAHALLHAVQAMLNANSKETNKSAIESCAAGQGTESPALFLTSNSIHSNTHIEHGRSHKRSLSSAILSALSGTHRAGRSSESDSPNSGQIPARSRSTIKKTRRPRNTPSSLSQSAISMADCRPESKKLTPAEYPGAPSLPYQIIPEEGTPSLRSIIQASCPSTPTSTPAASTVSECTVLDTAEASPRPSLPSFITPGNDVYSELPSSSRHRPTPAFLNHTRRKASMSKLMRHFGETRIPPELLVPPPDEADGHAVPDENVTFKKQRTKSLDLRPHVKMQGLETPEALSTDRKPLQRTRSLGQRSASLGRKKSIEETPLAEAAQDRVRRARKITQIFGPELPYELIVNTEQFQCRESGDILLRRNPSGSPSDNSPTLSMLPPAPCSSERASSETDHPVALDSSNERNRPANPASQSSRSDATDHRRRALKLAKFFGVTQDDISSSVLLEAIASPRPSGVTFASPPPPPLQEVEVNVKLAGRRFWGFSSPNRPEYRYADTNDAIVIDQLRTLKAT